MSHHRKLSFQVYLLDALYELGGLDRLDYLQNSCLNRDVSGAAEATIYFLKNAVKQVIVGHDAATGQPKKVFYIKQEINKHCGVGYKLWPAACILARWIWDNPEIFRGKEVQTPCVPP